MFVGSQFYHANWNMPKMMMVRALGGRRMPGRSMSSAPLLGRRGEDSAPQAPHQQRIGVTPVRALPGGTMQAKLMAEAHKHMPQGVAENYRYWGDASTVFVSKSKGCVLTDVDGKDFTDFRLGYGPIILGYCDERVDRAVCEEVRRPLDFPFLFA